MKKDIVYVDSADYDFGIIDDSIRILRHTFILHNTRHDTCYIKSIVKSCGCTKVYCNKKVVPPDEISEIFVEIDLGNNYNFFERDINIFTSSSTSPITLYVRASRKMPMHIITRQFPVQVSNNIRLSSSGILLGYIEHGKKTSKSINIINTSQSTVNIEGLIDNAPTYITAYFPQEMAPNEISRIIVSYDATNINDIWGEQEFVLNIKEKGGTIYPLKIYSIVTENFDLKDKCKPRILMPVTCYQLNSLETNKPIAIKAFEIRNIGNGDLIVRDIQVESGVQYKIGKKIIAPNDNTMIEIAIPHSILEEKKSINIGITTNDRMEPYKVFKVLRYNE